MTIIRAVLFDIDGTLVDSNERHVDAWAFAFRGAGRPQEIDAIRKQIGKGGELLVPALAPDMDERTQAAVTQAHGDHFKALYLETIRPFAGAAALLRRVHADGRRVVLASSAKGEELDHYVDLLGIADLVAATTSTDDVETSKPAPDIFAVALERVGLAPDEAIAVGDTVYDVEAAARSGIATIGVTSGPFDERELRDAGAVAVFADVAALLADIAHSPLRDSG